MERTPLEKLSEMIDQIHLLEKILDTTDNKQRRMIMTLEQQVEQAKKMHWGMYCGICDTCTRDAMCSVACPDGGVDDGKTRED